MIRCFVCLALVLPWLSGCGVLAGTLLDTGAQLLTYPFKEYLCLGAFRYDNTWDEPYANIETEPDPGELLVGVCISGGGSRSAYFMASVLEQLATIPVDGDTTRSMLDEVDVISSVSGGSLASAYYCLKRFEEDPRPLPVFFEEYKLDMGRNFQLRALARLVLGWWFLDFFTYYDRGDLLAGIWDDLFFDSATFADLAESERRGAPILIVNGTCLSNGLKFVFSTLPDTRFNKSALFKFLDSRGMIRYGASAGHSDFLAMGFQSINSDIAQYRVSKAVAASASVPNLLGPVTLRAGPEHGIEGLPQLPEGYLLNITDGGIYDNYGLESMVQVVTEYLDDHPGYPARILVIDGSGYFDLDADDYAGEYNVAYYSDRTLSISWLRTKSYMEFVFDALRDHTDAEGRKPYENLEYTLISLYTPLPSQLDEVGYLIDTDDKALQILMRPDVLAKSVFDKLTTIQTSFAISDEDALAIDGAAVTATRVLREEPVGEEAEDEDASTGNHPP